MSEQDHQDNHSAGRERDPTSDEPLVTQPGEESVQSNASEPATSAEGDSEALQVAVAEAQEKVLRTQAEMQNLRRRVDRDIENAHKFALEKFVAELLPIVDNLERAIAAIDPEVEQFRAVGEGVELTLKSLLDVLERNKVEQLNPYGQNFDPEFHQAMSMVPSTEVAANTVMEVVQKGYSLNGRLVRPAMVVVSRGAGN